MAGEIDGPIAAIPTSANETCGGPTVIPAGRHSLALSMAAIFIWIGALLVNPVLLISLPFCGSSTFFLILGALVFLVMIPVDEDSKLGDCIPRFVTKYGPSYFPMTVHIEDFNALNPEKSYILAAEPHSVFPIGGVPLMSQAGILPLKKTKALVSSVLFWFPFVRHIAIWSGLVPATRKNFTKYLEAGYSCFIIPGGVQEVLHMKQDHEIAYLKQRYGFIKVAIETGSPVVPVFSFGQRNAFRWWKPEGKLYDRIARRIGFAPLIFWGAFGTPFPYRKPVHIIVGRPIEFKRNQNPTRAEIAEAQDRFISAMENLFAKNRAVADFKEMELRII